MTKKPEDIAITPATSSEETWTMPSKNEADDITLSREQLGWIRDALLIGLASYGEIEKVLNAKELRKAMGQGWPQYLDVMHPTGDCEVVSKFATALMAINVA
jgi:hypothetical protein